MKLGEALEVYKHFAVFAHKAPDADAISSAMLTKLWLESLDENNIVDVFLDINEEEIPDAYKNILVCDYNKKRVVSYDCAVVVDTSNIERIALGEHKLEDFNHIINIDHHVTNTRFGDSNLVLKRASSAGEVLYTLMKHYDFSITDEMAMLIYTSIITDTNNLQKISISPLTYSNIGELLKYKFNSEEVKINFFSNNPFEKIQLQQKAIASLKFFSDKRIATIKLTQKDFHKTHANYEDSMGIVDNALAIEGVKIAACFIEKEVEDKEEPNIYVSLRGKGSNVDVVTLAKEFGGGGHDGVAAFQFKGSIKDIETQLVTKAIEIVNNITEDEEDKELVDY